MSKKTKTLEKSMRRDKSFAPYGLAAMLAASMTVAAPTASPAQVNTSSHASSQVNQNNGKHWVSGVIRDENGEELVGATIIVKETNHKTVTDANGYFCLNLDAREKTLLISFLGMKTQEVNIVGKTEISVRLEADENMLNDVIVTGYQTISKERATGAFNIITPESFKDRLDTDIMSRLEGTAAGLSQQQDGSFFIRGIATLRGGAEGYKPLIVVDGLPFEGKIESINPSTIKNITVLKDAAAASIYGARAANGVIVISTIDGGDTRRTVVQYDASVKFTPKPDMSSLHLMSSSELVDLQQYGFKFQKSSYETMDPRQAVNPVLELLYKHKANMISDTELNDGLNKYRQLDNRKQLEDYYARTGVTHQHNLSISGGNDKNTYALTMNYMGDTPNERYQSREMYGFTLRDNMKFFSWLKADIGVATNFTRSKSDLGMGRYSSMYSGTPSYFMLKDEQGNPLHIQQYKSEYELQRLVGMGLMDEHYSPITNRGEEWRKNAENYYRVQFGLNFKFTDYLNMDVKFQTENSSIKNETTYTKNAYTVRSMINNAAVYNSETGELTLNVPKGGQFNQTRGDWHSYTLRAQLNFDKEFGQHYVTAIGGAERRLTRSTSTTNYYMGYDQNSLGYKPFDPLSLIYLQGTEALGGLFDWTSTDHNYLNDIENRYVSFYANGSYSYASKYDLTASIRVDQSNLFGTDPKYQYRPLWSVGGSWHAGKEQFIRNNASWIDNLTLRLTYGIGGNVPKDAGPYLTLDAPEYNAWVGDYGSAIKNPPNPTLRWEKTATVNFGIDFSVLKHRLSGSIDLYNKNTTDLLAYRNADPTLGWSTVMLNYGTMYNRGIEIALNSRNIETKDFTWGTSLNFSYNKNKLTDVEDNDASVFTYTSGAVAVKGYALGSLFSYRYAGLYPKNGRPIYWVNNGTEKSSRVTEIADLVYSGTTIPKYNASLTNSLSYKNFDLSFMFVYYGGHVLRGEAAPYMSMAPTNNVNRDALNMWKQPGDENNPNTTPAMTGTSLSLEGSEHPWYAADTHVIKGDYIKLRDLSLTYNFEKSLISKLGLSALALTMQVQNLMTWHANSKGFDPEALSTSSYGWGARTIAVPTTWTFGISAKF